MFLAREHMAFHFILRTPGATHADLADFLGVTPSHVSAVVDSLEKKGMVIRIPDKVDRRIHRLEATGRAAEHHRRWHDRFGDPTSPIFAGWTEAEIETLRRLLQRLDAGGRARAIPIRSELPQSRGSSDWSA